MWMFGVFPKNHNLKKLTLWAALVVEWSKVRVFVRVLPSGYQGFEPWFQLELERDWELPRRDFPFKASSVYM